MKKCELCGKEITDNKYICDECEKKLDNVKRAKMIDKAAKLLGHDYMQSIDKVKERITSGKDNFSSVPEVCAAIQMEQIGLSYESQKDIGGAIVDFYIPEIHIILEIDGEIYHRNKDKAFLRDRRIMSAIGEDYEIVHIPASLVPRYTGNLRESLKHVVYSRNHSWYFRDSEYDGDFLEEAKDLLEEYHSFEEYLKGLKRGRKKRA